MIVLVTVFFGLILAWNIYALLFALKTRRLPGPFRRLRFTLTDQPVGYWLSVGCYAACGVVVVEELAFIWSL